MTPGFMLFFAAFCLVLLVLSIGYNYYFRIYFRAQMANKPLSLFYLIGLSLRGLNARVIVNAYLDAVDAGLDIDIETLEKHASSKGNVRRVVQTLIEAKRSDGVITIEEACRDDLDEHGMLEFPGAS